MSSYKALVPFWVQPTGRFYAEPGFFYLVDTSQYSGNVTFLLPPVAACEPSDHLVIKKITPDSNGIAVTPWYGGELLNASTSPGNITGNSQSHGYVPGCPASYGGQIGWVSW